MKSVWLAVAMAGIALKAQALGGLADIQVFDRDAGCVLPTYRHHGETWVAGRPGARYSIVIHNRRGERVLAVTSVDGVNVISGESGAWGQSGYVFSPSERYEIPGWRKSKTEVADFNFTAASDSYAARTGRPANVGVIGVALFLEASTASAPRASSSRRLDEDQAEARSSRTPSSAPQSINGATAAAAAPAQAQSAPGQPLAKLGTGHGTLEVSYAHDVPFNRQSSTPDEIIRIRYDSFENLVAMGVVGRHATPWPVPNPFPDSATQQYVPDPPGG